MRYEMGTPIQQATNMHIIIDIMYLDDCIGSFFIFRANVPEIYPSHGSYGNIT